MNMNNVRSNMLYLLYKCPRCLHRCQSMPVEQAGFQAVPKSIQAIAYGNKPRLARLDAITPFPVCDIAFPSVLHCQFADFLHDTPRRSGNTQHRIYLQQCFHAFKSLLIY